MLKYLVVMLTIVSCSSPDILRLPSSAPYQRNWAEYIAHNQIDQHGMSKFYPDPEYLGRWQKNDEFVMNKPLMPFQIEEKAFSCGVKKLYPTHPSEATKEYLYSVYSQYDHARIPPNSYACLRKNPSNRFCVRAAVAMMVVMSDTYVDECGNYYRGYWLLTYLKSDESMGTLLAKGRTVYEKPHAQFKGEYIEGDSYAVPKKDFMFFGELLPGDVAKIRQEKARALRSGFKMNGKLFVR